MKLLVEEDKRKQRRYLKKCDVDKDSKSLRLVVVCDKTGLLVGSGQCEKCCVYHISIDTEKQIVHCSE